MSKQEEFILKEIYRSIAHAAFLYEELPPETRNRINALHNEVFSLAHCLRWGETAIDEVRDYLNSRTKGEKNG